MHGHQTDTTSHLRLATDREIDWFVHARGLDHETPQDWGSDHYSPQLAIGLGREAVICAGNDIHTFGPWLFNKDGDVYTDGIAVEVNQYRSAWTEDARKSLENLKPKQRVAFEALLHGRDMPFWLNELVGLTEADMHDPEVDKASPLIAKLTQKAEDGTYTVEERTFLNFLEWHNYQLAQEQKKFDLQREGYVGGFEDAVRTAVEDGWMPEVALARLSKLREATIIMDDGLNTEVFDYSGYHRPAKSNNSNDLIVLSPDNKDRKHIFNHEGLHVIHGQRVEPSEGDTVSNHGRYAIGKLLDGKEFPSMAIVEACVEHMAGALGGDSIDGLDKPYNRKIANRYAVKRWFLGHLCNSGEKHIDIRLFINALMEDGAIAEAAQEESATAILGKALQWAFPDRDILADLRGLENEKDIYKLVRSIREEAIVRKGGAGKIIVRAIRVADRVRKTSSRKLQNRLR